MNQSSSNLHTIPDWPEVTRRKSSVVSSDLSGPEADSDNRQSSVLLAALLVAGAMHVAIIFGVTFEDIRDRYIPPSLDVILVNQPQETEPEIAHFLSEHSQAGGGTSTSRERPTAPVSGTETELDTGEAPRLVEAGSPTETKTVEHKSITQIFSDQKIENREQQEQVNRVTEQKEAESLSKRMEIARLTAELARDMQELANRPKTLYVTASTKKSTAANYMMEWVRKVERVGNLNYPPIAYKISGALVLVVGVNQHGSITEIAVKRSSGNAELDEAAVNIVKLAEPFPPMSRALAQETDIIYITRTWQFTSDHALYSH